MADSDRNQSGVWTHIWRHDFSKEEHVFSLESERQSVRWQKIKHLILKKYKSFSSLKIIEIGSGRGTYGLLAGLEGASVSLLDQEPLAFERARDFFGFWGKSFEAISADAFDLPEELLGQFDVVMSYGLAEHFRYPERFRIFESHLKLLKPGGLLIVSVPNHIFLPYRIGKFLLERLDRWAFGLEIPFSRKELGQIAAKLGLNHWRVMGSGLINDTLNFWLIQRLLHLPRYVWERFLSFLRRDTRKNVARLKDRFFYFPYHSKTWLDDYFGYALILAGEKPHGGTAASKSKRFLFPFLSFLVGCLFAFGIAECALRLTAPDWLKQRMRELNAGVQAGPFGTDQDWPFDAIGGQLLRLKPHAELQMRHYEYNLIAHTDEYGGRFVPQASHRPPLVPFMGDSFLFGLGVRDEETYVNLLSGDIPARVINLGVPGSYLTHQLDVIEWRHQELGAPPVYIFNFFTGNDLTDGYFHDRRLNKPPHDAAAVLNEWFYHHPLLKKIYLAQFVKVKMMLLVKRFVKRPGAVPWMDPVFLVIRKDEPFLGDMKNRLEQDLKRLEKLSKTLRFTPLFILIPDKHQMNRKLLEAKAKYYGFILTDLDARLPNNILHRALDQHGIFYLDTSNCLEEDPERDYYVQDGHLTPKGHQRVSECVSGELRDKILFFTGEGML